MAQGLKERCIADFGEQWSKYTDNSGFYGSLELFRDIFHPLLVPEEVAGCRVAEIGSGAGRIVGMLLEAGASHVTAVEPSPAIEVLRANVRGKENRVALLHCPGEGLPPSRDLDYVFSVGVLHHIPDPAPVVRAAYHALRSGGRIVVWLYGYEGNEAYLAVARPLRVITRCLPHPVLATLVWLLDIPLLAYVALCRVLPLPLRDYMCSVVSRLDGTKRRLTVYDQLNPAYAKYYRRQEAIDLLRDGGFVDVTAHHRHGYSWSVTARKP
jgi:SAM-dependent methyltransferase